MELRLLSLRASIAYLLCILLLFTNKNVSEAALDYKQMYTLCVVPGYDYFNLTALPWFVSVKSSACVPFPNATLSGGEQSDSKCLILMRYCQTLENFGIGCKNSSICQQSAQGDVSLGAYIDNPFVSPHASHDGFLADIPKGTSYRTSNGEPCELKTLVSFKCNQSVVWEAPGSYVGIKRAPDPLSVEYDADLCQLKLSFDYAGACGMKAIVEEEDLSIGSIVLVVFSITLVLYIVLGVILNLARGNSGKHLLPHVAVWTSLIGYIADGFKFVFCPGVKPLRAVAYEEIKS